MKLFGITDAMLGPCKYLTQQLNKLNKTRANLCDI